MPPRKQPTRPPALPGTLLLATALLASGVSGCSALSPFNTCDDTETRVKALRSQPVLESVPAGATVPKGLAPEPAGCIDDSGDAWLHAERIYVFPGPRQEVVDFYRATAEADGWHLQSPPEGLSSPETTAGLCFTRGGDGDALLLTVQFTTARQLKIEHGYEAGPEFDSGSGFEIEVGSETDGAKTGCFD
ncbi:hypothetical protein [Streptomyces sp. NPDC001876]|uniref:hypothetical protein n=1 Tax=Streptomyces sp. NPDC001876 TaxID=3154402 RepID=UPI0033277C4B